MKMNRYERHYEPDYEERGNASRERRMARNPLLRECSVHGMYTVDEWDRAQRCPECLDEEERGEK